MVQQLFFENPGKEFYLRQIARLTKTPKTTVARKLKELTKKGMIRRLNAEPFPLYISNNQKNIYRYQKRLYILQKIYDSGLVEHIIEQAHPNSIILYGSMADGDYDKDSDIDIFIEAEKAEIDFRRFEKKLKHRIHPWFELCLDDVDKHLRMSIINGVKLYGYIELGRVQKAHKKRGRESSKNEVFNGDEQTKSKSDKTT